MKLWDHGTESSTMGDLPQPSSHPPSTMTRLLHSPTQLSMVQGGGGGWWEGGITQHPGSPGYHEW